MHLRVMTLLGSALLLLGVARPAAAELARVWALDDGTKIRPGETSHRLSKRNGIFDGKSIKLFAARNEIVAFQLILQGGGSRSEKVRVRLPSVGDVENGELSSDPDRYFIGRRIEVFLQHYVKVSFRSHKLTWKPWTDAQPKGDFLGLIPDALIPLAADATFSVAAGRNQGAWIDIYVPKETKPGVHRGEVTVEIEGKPCGDPGCKLPVELKVLPQTLPDVPTAKTMLYFSGGENDRNLMPARYYKDPWQAKDEKIEALRSRHFKLGRRHRITMFIGQDEKPNDALAARISGKLFSAEAGYAGPGQGLGQEIYSINTYGSPKLTPAAARVWHEWFKQHGPKVEYFYYAKDEPQPPEFSEVNRLARNARPVPSFTTGQYQPGLEVDIYATIADQYDPAAAKRATVAGKRVWIYNGVRPFTGTFMIDDFAVSPRVNPWIQYKHGIPRWFYWESTYYKDHEGGRGDIDVFFEASNFSNNDDDRLNGDGMLIYPGRDVIFPTQDRGFDGPMPSIRLKNWRRGIQDVEYVVLAKKAGHAALVDKLLGQLLPRVLAGDLQPDEPASWPDDGEVWLRARTLLALALGEGKAPPVPELGKPAESSWTRFVRWAKRMKRKWWRGKRRLVVMAGAGGIFCFPLALWWWLRRRRRRREEEDY